MTEEKLYKAEKLNAEIQTLKAEIEAIQSQREKSPTINLNVARANYSLTVQLSDQLSKRTYAAAINERKKELAEKEEQFLQL